MCTCTCRVILFSVNVIVAVAGFFLALFGALISWGRVVLREQIFEHISPFVELIQDSDAAIKVTQLADSLLRFTAPFGFVIFGFGAAIMILCIFGCCGACRNNVLCLKIYTSLLLLISLIEVSLLIFYYTSRSTMFDWTRTLFEQSLLKYESMESEDPNSIIFNLIMPTLKCCGLINGTDFENAKNFRREVNISLGPITIDYPLTCCKMDSEFRILDDTCPLTFNENNSHYNHGCWQELYPRLIYYGNLTAIFGVVVLLLMVLLIVVSAIALANKQL